MSMALNLYVVAEGFAPSAFLFFLIMEKVYRFCMNDEAREYTYDSETGIARNPAKGREVNIGRGVDFFWWLQRAGAYRIEPAGEPAGTATGSPAGR